MTADFKFCNHHHKLTCEHKLVNFGDGKFVANKKAIPLLKALNELGLKTRTHHVDDGGGFVSIILDDNIEIRIHTINEIHASRTKYNNMKEVVITWRK